MIYGLKQLEILKREFSVFIVGADYWFWSGILHSFIDFRHK